MALYFLVVECYFVFVAGDLLCQIGRSLTLPSSVNLKFLNCVKGTVPQFILFRLMITTYFLRVLKYLKHSPHCLNTAYKFFGFFFPSPTVNICSKYSECN